MRMLGNRTSLSSFRWDLIYLLANLSADDRPGVKALAAPVQAQLAKAGERREELEEAEDALVVASALLHKKDKRRDSVLIEAGGIARTLDKNVYKQLFPKRNPSATARLGVKAESAEVRRILGEIAKLPAEHLVRAEYEQELTDAEAEVAAAGAQSDEAVTELALRRSSLARFKVETDELRLVTHGQLVLLLKDKDEADSFYRPVTSAPAGEGEKAPEDGGESP